MREEEKLRNNAVFRDSTGQGVICEPYYILPRRFWDLRSNRVISTLTLQAHIGAIIDLGLCTGLRVFGHGIQYLAVTHSWTDDMCPVDTSVSGSQWPVPLPSQTTLEQVRQQVLVFAPETRLLWLDAACLRQVADRPEDAEIQAQEWKIDVPTIGNVYRAASEIVRYFNGLGRAFSPQNWDSP